MNNQENYTERLKRVQCNPYAPSNLASITKFLLPDLSIDRIRNVKYGKTEDKKILEVFELILRVGKIAKAKKLELLRKRLERIEQELQIA